MAKKRTEMFANLPAKIFLSLHQKISRHALVLLKNQYLLALDRVSLKQCTEYNTRVLMIPCAHVICFHIGIKRHIDII